MVITAVKLVIFGHESGKQLQVVLFDSIIIVIKQGGLTRLAKSSNPIGGFGIRYQPSRIRFNLKCIEIL